MSRCASSTTSSERSPRSTAGRAARVVTIGAYDGVHLGHHAVLRLVRELADARGLDAVCSPSTATRPRSCGPSRRRSCSPRSSRSSSCSTPPAPSTSRSCCTSTRRAARSRPRTSCARCSSALLGARLVVVGADFHFGYRRGGDVALLAAHGRRARLRGARPRARRAEARPGRHEPYSSTRDPRAARRGRRRRRGRSCSAARTRCAARVERRPARPRARVPDRQRRGARRGSACPPTASTPARFVGADGVERPAAISLGRRPTFYEDAEHARCSRRTCSTSTATSTASAVAGPLRRAAPGRGALRLRRRPGRPDAARRRGRPAGCLELSAGAGR